jgi:glutaminase
MHDCSFNDHGKLPNYIPELAKVDPDNFGVSVCTIDGQRLNIGDSSLKFTL